MLAGATAFALPLNKGQRMHIKRGRGSDIKWHSIDSDGNTWFKGVCSLFDLKFEKSNDPQIADRLSQVLNEACRLNSDFLSQWYGFKITTNLEFSKDWGLGSSSSLVYCIAKWADVEPFELYDRTFGGSGYDIACAQSNSPLLYTRKEEEIEINYRDFFPKFADRLHFVYLGNKQNSRTEIDRFQKTRKNITSSRIDEVSKLSKVCAGAKDLQTFCEALEEMEALVSSDLQLEKIKTQRFSDFDGTIKSLGAWGGDFVIAASEQSPDRVNKYFQSKGLDTVIPFNQLVCQEEQEVALAQ